jgi:hypothetical protein
MCYNSNIGHFNEGLQEQREARALDVPEGEYSQSDAIHEHCRSQLERIKREGIIH